MQLIVGKSAMELVLVALADRRALGRDLAADADARMAHPKDIGAKL